MTLVITVRKEVPDQVTGAALYEQVAQWLEEHHPDLKYSGHLTNHFEGSEPPS